MSNINETWKGRSEGKEKKQNGMTIWVKGQQRIAENQLFQLFLQAKMANSKYIWKECKK